MTVTEEYMKAHFLEVLDIADAGETVFIIKEGESEPRLQLSKDAPDRQIEAIDQI